ncbi:Guanylate kinase [hydrothermal vent metagenome]|uniref:guanylate kinase n=1 Tax=hydrothermal vent metagenome TaxID=652676 RepID=A0A1W1BBH2_9ZZZZ
MNGAILVLSGPSGAGKSTIIHHASKDIGEYYFSISTTTREPREGEIDGVDYYFVSRIEFEKGIESGDFLEYATVHGNYYGTSLKPVQKALADNKLVIFDIDVQGHRLVRAEMGSFITSVFITPPSLAILKERLYARATDRDDIIKGRIENAKEEIKAIGEFDFVIINDTIEKASSEFTTIANASRLKYNTVELEKLIQDWQN